jgi:hypothetical protein
MLVTLCNDIVLTCHYMHVIACNNTSEYVITCMCISHGVITRSLHAACNGIMYKDHVIALLSVM